MKRLLLMMISLLMMIGCAVEEKTSDSRIESDEPRPIDNNYKDPGDPYDDAWAPIDKQHHTHWHTHCDGVQHWHTHRHKFKHRGRKGHGHVHRYHKNKRNYVNSQRYWAAYWRDCDDTDTEDKDKKKKKKRGKKHHAH